MKSNFKLKKIFCCIVLSFVLAFGNVLDVSNRALNKNQENQENQVYAADNCCRDYYYDSTDIEPIHLMNNVELTGKVHYVYSFYTANGNEYKVFDSIDKIDIELIGDDAHLYDCYLDDYTFWAPERYYAALVQVYVTLRNKVDSDELSFE